MALRAPLVNFSRGEVAPDLQGRFDVSSYNAGLKTARNVVVLKTGAVTMRPGTRLVGEVYDSTNLARLVPFQFSLDQTYALELGQGTMRPAALGGFVLETALTITGITQANPAVVACAYHGYVVGDDVFFSGVLGMVEINGRTGRVVAVPDAGHYAVAIDGTGFSAFTGDTGGTANTAPPAAPPTAPVVPPVVAPPDPPPVAGGGRGGGGGGGTAIP